MNTDSRIRYVPRHAIRKAFQWAKDHADAGCVSVSVVNGMTGNLCRQTDFKRMPAGLRCLVLPGGNLSFQKTH